MKKNKDISAKPSELRSRAEKQLKKHKAGPAIPRTEEETQKLLHELQVHQIELEMQNEELRRATEETESMLARYTELYDFAPAGYFTLGKDGIISSINLTGTLLLGTERARLIKKSFNLFVADEDRPVFISFLKKVFEGKGKESCDVRLRKEGNQPFFVYIEAKVIFEELKCHVIVLDITKRRQAEEALRKSNALNKSVIDSSSDCIKILDLEGRLQYISQGGQLLLGIRDIGKYLNVPYQEFWKGADNQAALEALHKAQQGKLGTFQGYCPTEDGTPKWWDVAVTPIFDAEGKPERLLAVSRDITGRKKIEDAQLFLVQSGWLTSGEDFFKSLARYLAENLGMDYVCIDRLLGEGLSAQTLAVYFDGKFEDNVSYTLKDTPCGDVVGKTICLFPEGVRNLYPKDVILQEMLAESYVGTTLWSSDGQPIGLIAIIGRLPLADSQLAESMLRLVSLRAAGELERRQAEEALRQSEESYRSLFENMIEGFAHCRMLFEDDRPQDFIYLDVNSAFENLTGLKNIVGRKVTEVIPGIKESYPELFEIYGRVALTGEPERFEIYLEPLAAWLSVYAYSVEKGDFVAVFDNITERKKSEEQIKKLNDDLQLHAQEVELAYKDMESFSYSISHDLRAPLRIIDSMSEIVLKDYYDKLDDDGRRLLNSIQRNASRMDQLVLALLDLSKVGRQKMKMDEIDMEEEAALIAADLKAANSEQNIAVTIKNLPPAYGDVTLIRQVLTNLLSNAVKFTKTRDVSVIEIGDRHEGREDIYYVKDNGVGFNMDYADKLFMVFHRLHSLQEFEGIGIGLSIVNRIIQRHGGRVWAEGRPDEGATFYFSLPVKVG